jgi:hypothetical protein
MTLTEQHRASLATTDEVGARMLSKRREWEDVAILAISAAFKNTPPEEHQALLNSIYEQIITRVFGDEVKQ